MRCFGYRWVQGDGFEGLPQKIGPFASYQAAYGRIKRANRFLDRKGLQDWYASGRVEKQSGEWWITGAEVCAIG